ncbi:MAG TPA: methionine--tRNA ligase [Dehalococcoidia bacterium]|nr:methionine--tRNA ligase [Dehalococcoidia bacterium]
MSERIFIGVGWPYANGPLHLGHIAGAYLPADIFARYHRMKGNEVLMVSGSDQHGTPITIKADQEGKTPDEITRRYHNSFLESWENLGISWDIYTSTGTTNHAEVTHDMFLTLQKNGYIFKSSMSQPYCHDCGRFLPDRYVEGTCPYCDDTGARGDQCDRCGKPLNAAELNLPRCAHCGTPPEFRETEHFFMKLSAFQERLTEWVEKQSHWRPNVRNFTLGFLREGLNDRAITRDIDWGITIPVEGFEDKRIYVWFEAVIGYLSASKEWARTWGEPEKWRDFWQGEAKAYYFIGKDNTVFHTMNWPAMLMGYEGLNLPYDVPANEFLTIESKKGSKSRNWAVWLNDFLERYDPDPLRYLLSINMPETSDTDFTWAEFIRKNNDELVATYGNLVNRVLTFTYKNYDGRVPTHVDMGAENGKIPLDEKDNELINKSVSIMNDVLGNDGYLSRCRFKQAIATVMSLAHEANRYLDEKEPWKVVKENREKAAVSLYVTLAVIIRLKTMMYPFLPFTSQKLHEYLGYERQIEEYGIHSEMPVPGQLLQAPKPLFTKLDPESAKEELAKLGQTRDA